MKIKNIIKSMVPFSWIRRRLNKLLEGYYMMRSPARHRKALLKLRDKPEIKVVFFAINSSAWKFERLYRLFEKSDRFDPVVIICPLTYYGEDHMMELMAETYGYFQERNYKVVSTYDREINSWLDIKKDIAPDIIFFTHSWGLTRPEYQIRLFLTYLTCYSPYSFNLSELHRKSYADFFYSVLWKNFLETEFHQEFYKKNGKQAGNGVVTGYPGTDIFRDPSYKPGNPWKNNKSGRKRIIWAPHHTIPGQGVTIDFSSFCTYADFMVETTYRYKDKIQVAFKPHPLLKNKLYKDSGWGKEKADLYFSCWEEMENGQLCESDYTDLFLTSDGMILDSISFIAEYLYTMKPSQFIMNDNNIEERLNDFGRMAVGQHYHAYNEKDITDFIEEVVIEGNDRMREEREAFFNRYLQPPDSSAASENIFNEVRKYFE